MSDLRCVTTWSKSGLEGCREAPISGLQNLLAEAQALRAELAGLEGDPAERARASDEAVRIYLSCGNHLAADRAKALR